MTLERPSLTFAQSAGGSGRRAVERCRMLTRPPFSDEPDQLFRGYLSPAHSATCGMLAEWMCDAGMETRIDPAGNFIGRYAGETDGPVLLIGSHIDSVRDAGAFDGPLGIMLGIECVAMLHAVGKRLPFAIDVIAFGDEEGSRFPAAMLTSRAVAGTLDPASLAISDADGVTLAEALADIGLDSAEFPSAAYKPGSVRAYLEAHIEQGPVLEAEKLPLGIVSAIAGQCRLAVTFKGVAGHAGTNAMHLRRDALTAAAEGVLAIERIASAGKDDLVATVGRMTVAPGATNVVPGRVEFTIDIRSGSDTDRDDATTAIIDALRIIATERRIGLSIEKTQVLAASPCDPGLTDRLADAVAATGQLPRRLVSGAGHDAMVMAALAPTAMLFIRCTDGISHNPAEDVIVDDVERALRAMLLFVEGLAS